MNTNIRPQEVIVCETNFGNNDLSFTRQEDSQINFDMFEPGKRYLVNYEPIDDEQPLPGIAKFTIGRNDGTTEELYGLNGPEPTA